MFLFTRMTTFNHNNVFAEALTRRNKNKNFDIDQKQQQTETQKHRNTKGKRKKIKNYNLFKYEPVSKKIVLQP